MGVRGLTGFIARHAELYLTPFELHDCNLVIDGDNLACNLYRDVAGAYSAFGGSYDDFYRAVVNFFVVLAECNIKSYVLMDGGYEERKLRTVAKRMRGKISVIKKINPASSITVFPVLMKEVFVDAVRDCNVAIMRCVFEADDELAALSRKLNCPVLSYDSDFYIHNVKYIPLITLTVKAHTNVCISRSDYEQELPRRLRKNEAKKVEKLTRGGRIMGPITLNNEERKKGNTYKYLDCCLYRVENLIARGSLDKKKLPIFAAMLGNDYISRSAFRNFFLNGMGKIGRSRKTNQQQRRIKMILQWLKNETAETALAKIITRLQKTQRESLLAQVEAATSGYSNEQCLSYYFFRDFEEMTPNDDDSEYEENEEYDSEEDTEESYEEDDSCDESCKEVNDQELEGDEEHDSEEDAEDVSCDESCKEVNDQEQEGDIKNENSPTSDKSDEDTKDDRGDITEKISKFPQWFLKKLYPANLPRFLVDLMHIRKYINNPQIEHFPFNDCNEIALPILRLTYSLLNNVKGAEFIEQTNEDGTLRFLYFTYLTRATRVTNIHYVREEVKDKPKFDFYPETPNPLLLQTVFDNKFPEDIVHNLFMKIKELPEDIQLYFLSIVYWLYKSQHCDLVHLNAIIICLVLLRTIDSKIPPERDIKTFHKRFSKVIKKERQVRDSEEAAGIKRVIKDDLKLLSIPERMSFIPKSDCYLVQYDMLKHFHMQEIFKKKYDLYSSTVLHAFAEFQSVVFQLHSLNALLDFPYEAPHLGQLYSGVLLYNLYDLLKSRIDISFYVKAFIFKDSQMMFDFYDFLLQWCQCFLPSWKMETDQKLESAIKKKVLKKKRQLEKKAYADIKDPNADMLSHGEDEDKQTSNGENEFFDINNKFCIF